MFGKGKSKMSGTSKFIMAAGRAVGNISPPASSTNRKGNGSVSKTAPTKDKSTMAKKQMYTETRGSKSVGKVGTL